MAKQTQPALERLLPKLTALRKTLRGEERKLLDGMVLGAQEEVTAHSSSVRARQTPAKIDSKVSEISMHSANVRQKILGSKTAAAEPRQTAGRQTAGRIELDARAGVYRVTIL